MVLDVLVTYLASYLLRIQIFLAYCVFISLYLRRVAKNTAPGSLARAALSAPIVLSNFAVPALFSRETEICTALAVCFLLSWLGNFKVRGTPATALSLRAPSATSNIPTSFPCTGDWALPQSWKSHGDLRPRAVCNRPMYANHAADSYAE